MRPSLLGGQCNGEDHITPGPAALRDFNPAYVGSGSKAALQPCRLQCPVCPKADIARRSPRCHPGDCRHSRNGIYGNFLLPIFVGLSHSGLIPASLMIGPHISVSDASRAASSAGVDTVTGAPMASYLSLTEGCSSAATASARILVAISFGVFACTNNPHQGDTSNPGIDSAIAGISGAAGERFGEVTAMPRMVLFWCWDMTPGRLLNIASTRPGMRSFMASAAPR